MRRSRPRSKFPLLKILYPFSRGFVLKSALSLGSLGLCCDIGQISALLGRSQAIAYDKTLIHQKTKVIRLEGYSAGGLLVQQHRQFHAGCAPAGKMSHQEFTGDS